MSLAIAKRAGRKPRGFYVPADVLRAPMPSAVLDTLRAQGLPDQLLRQIVAHVRAPIATTGGASLPTSLRKLRWLRSW